MINEQPAATLEQQYAHMVGVLFKPGADIAKDFGPAKANLLHATVGIASEAGELLDRMKKIVIYGKTSDDDLANIIEELGDMEFYMEALRKICLHPDGTPITREETLRANMNKLAVRYSQGYSDQAAIDRKDKA